MQEDFLLKSGMNVVAAMMLDTLRQRGDFELSAEERIPQACRRTSGVCCYWILLRIDAQLIGDGDASAYWRHQMLQRDLETTTVRS